MADNRDFGMESATLADEALDRSGEGNARSKYCIGPRPTPKPSWIDRA